MSKKLKVCDTKGIVVATPAYGGNLSVNYTNSLLRSSALFQSNGLKLNVMFLSNHSLITMARNKIVAEIFKNDKYDWESIVWIDSDISWEPEDLLKLALHDEDVVAGTYRKKIHHSCHFTLKMIRGNETPDERGLIEIEAVGTGFLRVSRKAMQDLLDSEKTFYTEENNATPTSEPMIIKNLFETGVKDGQMLSEDFFFCAKLRDRGYKIMLDTNIDLGHDGGFTYRGSMSHFLNHLKEQISKADGKDKVD
jgi:hypothetical protein